MSTDRERDRDRYDSCRPPERRGQGLPWMRVDCQYGHLQCCSDCEEWNCCDNTNPDKPKGCVCARFKHCPSHPNAVRYQVPPPTPDAFGVVQSMEEFANIANHDPMDPGQSLDMDMDQALIDAKLVEKTTEGKLTLTVEGDFLWQLSGFRGKRDEK